jgi:hypothetical protein
VLSLLLRVLLVLAVVWLVAIAVSLLTGPDTEAPGEAAPGVEEPGGGTRPALDAASVVQLPAPPQPARASA